MLCNDHGRPHCWVCKWPPPAPAAPAFELWHRVALALIHYAFAAFGLATVFLIAGRREICSCFACVALVAYLLAAAIAFVNGYRNGGGPRP